MADHIDDLDRKGKFFMWTLVYIVLFIVLLIYIYRSNLRLVFE